MSASATRNLKLETRNSTFTRTIGLPVPMLDAKVFLKLLQLDLKAHPPAPILKVRLSATPAQPRTTQGRHSFCRPRPNRENLNSRWLALRAWWRRQSRPPCSCLIPIAPKLSACNASFLWSLPEKGEGRERHFARAGDGFARLPSGFAATVTLRDGESPTSSATSGKKFTETSSGWPAPGDLPATGGSRMGGLATNGTSRCSRQSLVVSRQQSPVARLQSSSPVVSRQQILRRQTFPGIFRLVHDLLSGHWFVEGTYD